MALRELKSDLRNLKYGKDRPGGGSSGLPYIKYSLSGIETEPVRTIIESARFSSDYPQRGGLYAVRAAAEDAIRIRKFLTDFPKGSNFTSKQVDLQKSNPLIETGKNGGRINTRTYNLNSNLLLSTLTAGTGIHYPRSGATPLTLLEDDVKYLSLVGKKPSEENRLVNLYNSKIIKIEGNTSILDNLGIASSEFQIMNYDAGPNSLYGNGETIIFRSTDNKGSILDTRRAKGSNSFSHYILQPTTGSLGNNLYFINSDISSFLKSHNSGSDINNLLGIDGNGNITQPINYTFNSSPFSNTLTYDQISKKIQGEKITDFRRDVGISGSVFSRDYTNPQVPMTTRIGIGSPGARPRLSVGTSKNGRENTNNIFKDGQDKVNMTPIYYGNFNEHTVEKDPNSRDLIKFAFETIDNNNTNNTYRTHFRAFLKGFTDNNSADWEGKRYSGRGENMYTYQGFDRTISFNFIILAQSKQEMKPLWQKLNYLNSTLQPDYSLDGFMRGNITRLTIGEYLYRTPGIIKSLNYTVDDNYSWEIKMDEPEGGRDNDMMELPHAINVSVSFTPIFHTLPRTVTLNDFEVPSLISENIGDQENFIRDKNPFFDLNSNKKL